MHVGRVVKLWKEADGDEIRVLSNGPTPSGIVGAAPENVGQDSDNLCAWAKSAEKAPEECGGLADATGSPRGVCGGWVWAKGRIQDDVSRLSKGEGGGKATAGPYTWKRG